ncbi:hypothetical protein BJY04DRAFT_229286 [Aspergillus karnatakaensis]|uniref:fumarylacetoacetate hydrolase family protein n=1 Tax=Aspergillus karnatakaensis TaxID=1810916 RepID=UPI003CCE40D2
MTSPKYSHHFSINNIPYGIASSQTHPQQAATRLHNTVILLGTLQQAGFFSKIPSLPENIFSKETLNEYSALPKDVHEAVRTHLQSTLADLSNVPDDAKADISTVQLHLPVAISGFTDFSNSLNHVQNAGRAILNDPSPPPGFFHFPIAYTGRASTIVVSGTPITRPKGHFYDRTNPTPKTVIYGPCRALDYEVELGVIVGRGFKGDGEGVSAKEAEEHVFGWVIVNDWSARDIQGLEMIPLGPLNGKSFGTTISPWIITTEALTPYKVASPEPRVQLAPHLQESKEGNYDIRLTVEILHSASGNASSTCELEQEENGKIASTTAQCPASSLFWTHRQMLAHVTSVGADLRTGDLLATGTVSGEDVGQHGCLLESTKGGKEKVIMADGSERVYLLDGDEVRITAVLGGDTEGVGFGECIGEIRAAR